MPSKTCTACHRDLPATTEFWHRNVACEDGLHTICKPCRRDQCREQRHSYYQRNKDQCRTYSRNYYRNVAKLRDAGVSV